MDSIEALRQRTKSLLRRLDDIKVVHEQLSSSNTAFTYPPTQKKSSHGLSQTSAPLELSHAAGAPKQCCYDRPISSYRTHTSPTTMPPALHPSILRPLALSREDGPFLQQDLTSYPTHQEQQRDPQEQPHMLSQMRPMTWEDAGPRLGYDWIAAMLDSRSPIDTYPDTFFEELATFRRLNRDECESSILISAPYVGPTLPAPLQPPAPSIPPRVHIDDRLFPEGSIKSGPVTLVSIPMRMLQTQEHKPSTMGRKTVGNAPLNHCGYVKRNKELTQPLMGKQTDHVQKRGMAEESAAALQPSRLPRPIPRARAA